MIGNLLSFIGRIIISLRYRVKVTGYKEIAASGKRGIIFLPNHPAFIDPIIMVTHLYPMFRPIVLADRDQVDLPVLRTIVKKLNIIMMADPAVYGEKAKSEIDAAFAKCRETLNSGGNVLLYPAGHTSYTRYEELGGASGAETLIKSCPNARIVLVRTSGLWGSVFSRSAGIRPDFFRELKRGIGIVFSNLIFFTPRRKVIVTMHESSDFPKDKTRAEMNRFMESFYNVDLKPRTYVPFHFYQGYKEKEIPETAVSSGSDDVDDIPASIRDLVSDKIKELTGVTTILPESHLSRDLAMDSLVKIELLMWMENEFGVSVKDPESVQTVAHAMRAALGTTSAGTVFTLKKVPAFWFKKEKYKTIAWVPEGSTIPELFLKQAKKNPRAALAADQSRGVMTYGSLVLAVMVLKTAIQKLEGEYIGIMLPSVSPVLPLVLSVQFSGKIPVMINWTVGERSMNHSLTLLGVKHILTSKVFVEKLESQGANIASVKDRFLYLEELGKTIGTFSKIGGLLKSKISWRSLRKAPIKETAVVLFTSGSENLPKAVPLTHENIITNIRDAVKDMTLWTSDCFIGFLPPFHSFGLTATYFVPLCSGMRVVYHPNPTEGTMISKIIGAYRASILVGTPTFLDGVTRTAADKDVESIRLSVSGAEKCPDKLYDFIASKWPGMTICEGYGITECSPIVSGNRMNNPVKGTIGKVLSSIEYVIRNVDTGERVSYGEKGMLYVRGKSIFKGYLHYDGSSPFEEFEGKQWYKTGDLVSESPDGTLTFAGRLKRFIKLGGEMISLPAIETVLLEKYQKQDEDIVLAVESSAAESNPEIILFTVIDIKREEANLVIREAGLSPLHNIRIVKRVEKIPLLGTGKTDYRTLKEAV
jgi:acyl-CoA synthetase (AMP-forming)/AMP-acid ligase II/1-acyl-sn-glycerol-3-phosphate acyltransferase/acyl carrier protein